MDNLIFYGYELVSAFIPFLIVFMLFRNIHKKKETVFPKSYYAVFLTFALYIIGVYHFTGAGTLYDGLTYQLELKQDQLNFIPFSNDVDITAYLLNVLLFIPLGFLVPCLWQKMDNLFYLIGNGFGFSLFIEISQLLNNRRSDIDDLILNTLGAVVGFALYKMWTKCTKAKFQVIGAPVVELPICIFTIFIGRFLLFNEIGLAKLLYGF